MRLRGLIEFAVGAVILILVNDPLWAADSLSEAPIWAMAGLGLGVGLAVLGAHRFWTKRGIQM
jgi:hypothetical protein